MNRPSKTDFERHLNDLFPPEEAGRRFPGLAKKKRIQRLGSLLRAVNIVKFNQLYGKWISGELVFEEEENKGEENAKI